MGPFHSAQIDLCFKHEWRSRDGHLREGAWEGSLIVKDLITGPCCRSVVLKGQESGSRHPLEVPGKQRQGSRDRSVLVPPVKDLWWPHLGATGQGCQDWVPRAFWPPGGFGCVDLPRPENFPFICGFSTSNDLWSSKQILVVCLP